MLERLPRAHAPPSWSDNSQSVNPETGRRGNDLANDNATIIQPSSQEALGGSEGFAVFADPSEQKRGRSPFAVHRLHAASSAALSASPNTSSSTSAASDQDWRRSLHTDFDPIHKESGRSTSREPAAKRQSPPVAGAVPIQVNNPSQPSLLANRMSFAAAAAAGGGGVGGTTDGSAFVESSPSSHSSFSHRATSVLSDPSRIWGFDSGSPTGRSGTASSMKATSANAADDTITSTADSTKPTHTPWQHPAARRSLSNSGMSADRDQGRPLGVQRALSINTSSLLGQGVFAHNFSPSSLRSTSPDSLNMATATGNGNGNVHSSPRHGLGRLPEGEEASDSTGSFFTPVNAHTFLPAHYGGVSRMRSSSSAAALQGAGAAGGMGTGMMDRSAYGGRPVFDHTNRSASVWSNVPATADVMGSSPGSFTYAHASSARPASLSRFASDMVYSPAERGRARDAFGAGQPTSFASHNQMADVFAQSAQAESFAQAHESLSRSGSDSRRHSLAAAPPLAGQRRAIGFEVSSPAIGGRATSVGRFAGNRFMSGGSGSLAFSDEDLAADLDGLRIQPPDNRAHASNVGAHPASVPLAFQAFGFSPSDRPDGGWPAPTQHRAESGASAVWNVEARDDNNLRNPNLSSHSQTFSKPAAVAPAPLSDQAIASLATLGPLAPPSGGPAPHESGSNLQDLGKGVPLQMLARDTKLYIVEFKQGRTDLYFRQSQPGVTTSSQDAEDIRKGDLVIVEADRGKDLGSVINDSITVEQVQTFLHQQAELAQLSAAGNRPDGVHPAASTLTRLTRSVNPKRLFAKAGPADTNLLHAKTQDEERALTLCSTKVNQRGLPMAVVAAEMQWDRRKLTFYYTATQRVDFRDLVKELFRLYKTRIWMCHLSHPTNSSGAAPSSTSATTTTTSAGPANTTNTVRHSHN